MKDHREISKSLELYSLTEESSGQGFPLLLPNFVIIKNQIQQLIQKEWKRNDFQEVSTPVLADEELYKISGHLEHYKKYMFLVEGRGKERYFLRPMTCPHHCLIYKRKIRSYRELPIRLAENSLLFRYETSGSLKGLERVRNMEMSDHHIFVSLKQLKEEIKKNFFFIEKICNKLQIKKERLVCSINDPNNKEKYHDNYELWEKANSILKEVLEEIKETNYVVLPGEAAFYGPKIDFEVKTIDKKFITIATIQLDFLLPIKFDLKYLDEKQQTQRPIMIHQSPIGTYQRLISFLIEKTQGKLPPWLAPCQIAILPANTTKFILEFCKKSLEDLKKNEIRALLREKKTLNYRIRELYLNKIPYFLVIGEKEIKNQEFVLNNTYKNTKTTISNEKDNLIRKIKEILEINE